MQMHDTNRRTTERGYPRPAGMLVCTLLAVFASAPDGRAQTQGAGAVRAPSITQPVPAPAPASRTTATGDARRTDAVGCLIEPSVVVDVGSPVIGVIERVLVERGDIVRKGQVVAQLDSKVERAAVAVAVARAQNEAEVVSAQQAQDFAKRKQDRNESLYRQNYISNQALDQAATESRLADAKFSQAQEQRVMATQEVKLSRAQLAQRTIYSPVSGVVVERYMSAGERIEEKPIVRLAAIDPLRVELILPSTQFGRIRTGQPARVQPDLPGAKEHPARVTVVDRVIDPASNTFRVRLELPNSGFGLPSGLRCKVAFDN
jgi:RND family efflux transporter MFP subunit